MNIIKLRTESRSFLEVMAVRYILMNSQKTLLPLVFYAVTLYTTHRKLRKYPQILLI